MLAVKGGLIGRRNVVLTALEILGIAAAALAGFLIGKFVTHQTKDGWIDYEYQYDTTPCGDTALLHHG